MIDFVLGIALGAAFAPFWMKVWAWIRDAARGAK
jgi:hypothetical protein